MCRGKARWLLVLPMHATGPSIPMTAFDWIMLAVGFEVAGFLAILAFF